MAHDTSMTFNRSDDGVTNHSSFHTQISKPSFDTFYLNKSYQKGGTTLMQNYVSQQGRRGVCLLWANALFLVTSSPFSSPLLPDRRAVV